MAIEMNSPDATGPEEENMLGKRKREEAKTFPTKTLIVVGVVAVIIILIIILAVVLTLPGETAATDEGSQDMSEGTTEATLKEKGLMVIPSRYIKFRPEDSKSYSDEVKGLKDFVDSYNTSSVSGNVIECNETSPNPVPEDKTCYTSVINTLYDTDCYRHDYWGFNDSKPCLIFTFAKHDFVPEEFDHWENLPDDMPPQLKGQIKTRWYEYRKVMEPTLWIHCTNALRYSSRTQGFKLFELQNPEVEGHRSPVTNVVFDFRGKRGRVDVECRVWAKNIDHKNGEDDWAKVTFTVDIQE